MNQQDEYLHFDASYKRLEEEYKKYQSLVIAFDFDNTVYDFHKKGNTYHRMIDLLKRLKLAGCYMICFTGNEDINFVIQYLRDNNIPFDTINENPPFFNSTSRKIYFNALLDDRAGLLQVYQELNLLLNKIQFL